MERDNDKAKKVLNRLKRIKDLAEKLLLFHGNECMDDEMLIDGEDSTYLTTEESNTPDKSMDPQSSKANNVVTKSENGCKGFNDRWSASSDSEDSTDQVSKELRPPDKFICPLTKQVMSDPVILSSGKIVERKFIEVFFENFPSCRNCPVTKKQLQSHELITDDALWVEIKRWQENSSINDERRDHFRMLLRRLTYSGEDQLSTAAELRALVHDFPSYADVFHDIGPSAVLDLSGPLLSKEPNTRESLHEDIIVTLCLLAKHNNKTRRFFMDHHDVVKRIAEFVVSGSLETRRSAVTLVYYVAAVPGCRELLNLLGVTKHLVELVEEGNLLLLNDVILALYRLNLRSQRVVDGILSAIGYNLWDENQISNLECLLNLVMKDKVVWNYLVEKDAIYNEKSDILIISKSDAVKAFSVATLLRIVRTSDRALLATRTWEEECNFIAQIVEEGNPQAKETALTLLHFLFANNPDQMAATEIHQNELQSTDIMIGSRKLVYTAQSNIHNNELESADDHMAAAEVPRNELKSAYAIGTDKLYHTEEPRLHFKELLHLLQESQCGDVMEIWTEALLRKVEGNEAALIATWKREKNFEAITRVLKEGNLKAREAAGKILDLLNTLHPDQIKPHVTCSDSALLATRNREEESNLIAQVVDEGTLQAIENGKTLLRLPDANKPDQMSATEIHYHELLNLLQETEDRDVMEIWAEALLRQVKRDEAALIATWKRERSFNAITRVQFLGNTKAWFIAEEIFELLEAVHPDQIKPDT